MISRRDDCTAKKFFTRTIAAQMHLLTFLAGIAGLVYMLSFSGELSGVHFWGSLVFCSTALLVFWTSALYHFLHDGFHIEDVLTELMEKLDQCAIYLFIAGTYTPFILHVLQSPWREFLMITVWTLALVGILYTLFRHKLPQWAQSRWCYTGVFVLMGWTLVVRVGEVFELASAQTLALLLAGGAAYSIGAIVYVTKKPKLFEGIFGFHELWHGFVTLGFVFHYLMILDFYQ